MVWIFHKFKIAYGVLLLQVQQQVMEIIIQEHYLEEFQQQLFQFGELLLYLCWFQFCRIQFNVYIYIKLYPLVIHYLFFYLFFIVDTAEKRALTLIHRLATRSILRIKAANLLTLMAKFNHIVERRRRFAGIEHDPIY